MIIIMEGRIAGNADNAHRIMFTKSGRQRKLVKPGLHILLIILRIMDSNVLLQPRLTMTSKTDFSCVPFFI